MSARALCIGLLGLVAFHAPADAAVRWDEGILGDVSDLYLEAPDLGPLLDGDHTLIGSLSGGAGGTTGGPDEFDNYAFTAFATWSLEVDRADGVSLSHYLGDPAGTRISTGILRVGEEAFPPQPDGSYVLQLIPGSNSGDVSYEVTIVVPEASIAGSGVTALVGLAMLRARAREWTVRASRGASA